MFLSTGGRHRGLPIAIDRAVLLPSDLETLHGRPSEEAIEHGAPLGSQTRPDTDEPPRFRTDSFASRTASRRGSVNAEIGSLRNREGQRYPSSLRNSFAETGISPTEGQGLQKVAEAGQQTEPETSGPIRKRESHLMAPRLDAIPSASASNVDIERSSSQADGPPSRTLTESPTPADTPPAGDSKAGS